MTGTRGDHIFKASWMLSAKSSRRKLGKRHPVTGHEDTAMNGGSTLTHDDVGRLRREGRRHIEAAT